MDFKKWEDIIVSWVNCLKLSSPISELSQLRNGLFFTEIIKILKPSDVDDAKDICLPSYILKLLDTQYPNLSLDSENIKDLEHISDHDMLILASLLLHFSCVLDRRDVLTSPLCHQLPKITQIKIRFYLENMLKDIKRKDFYTLIQNCMRKDHETPTSKIQHDGIFSVNNRSPLQELLLQTPVRHRSFAKDRELKKLRSEIELERFEKSDLQDELKCQQTKNTKLNKEVSEKGAEIMRLRSEIANLESRILPSDDDLESAELQRRLRGEINSLEQYVAKLQNELGELYIERDAIREKLRKVEGQCTIWQEKSSSTEQDFDDLIEKHKQQEIEINCLRSHCNEMSALLEEMRASNRPNESCIDATINLENTEDLACSVVDVQLRDVQKDNVILKNSLKECRENSSKLQYELTDAQDRFKQLEEDFYVVRNDNERLIIKVAELTESETALFNIRKELEISLNKVSTLSFDNASLEDNISTLHKKLNDTNSSYLNVEAQNLLLTKEIQSLQSTNNTLTREMQTKSESFCLLQQQAIILQAQYDNLLDQYNKTDYGFKSITVNFDLLNRDVENNLQKLEQLILGTSSCIDLEDKNKAFEILFSKFKMNTEEEVKNTQSLISRIDCFEELNAKLRNEIISLEDKEVLSLQERHQLYDNLNIAEIKINLLENTITEQLAKIEELTNMISELTNTIKELEEFKILVEQKHFVISDLKQVNESLEAKLKLCYDELEANKCTQSHLQQQLENAEHIKNDFEGKINQLQEKLCTSNEHEQTLIQGVNELQALNKVFKTQISETTEELLKHKSEEEELVKTVHNLNISKSSLERQITDAKVEIEQQKLREELLENDFLDREKQHHMTLNGLHSNIDSYTKKIQELELELQNCKFTCAAAEKDIITLQGSREDIFQQMDVVKKSLNAHINTIVETKIKLENKLEVAYQDAFLIKEQLQLKCKEYNELLAEKEIIVKEYYDTKEQLQECKRELLDLDSHCKMKDDLFCKTTQDLLAVKLDVEVKSEFIANLEHNMNKNDSKIQDLEHQIASMNEQNEELRIKTTEVIKEKELLECCKHSLQNKCAELEANGWRVINDLSNKNEQLEDLLGKYNRFQEVTQEKLNSLEVALLQSQSDVNYLTEIRKQAECEKNVQIHNIQSQVDELTDVIEAFKQRETEYIQEIRALKNELNDNIKKYTEALEIRQELAIDNDFQVTSLTENLHCMIQKYNDLDVKYIDTVKQLENLQAHIETLENAKIELEYKIMVQNIQFDENYKKCVADLKLQIQEKTDCEEILQNEMSDTIKQLNLADKNYNDLQNHVKKLYGDIIQLRAEKAKLFCDLESFKNAFLELKNLFKSLKDSHLEFVNSNTNNFLSLKVELLEHIGLILTKNNSLSGTINALQKQVNVLGAEQERISATHVENLFSKDNEINTLNKDNEDFKENVRRMVQDKEILEKCLAAERLKVSELQTATAASNDKLQECLDNIASMKSTYDVLETAKTTLEAEILSRTDKIVELEKLKFDDYNKYSEEIVHKDAEIETLSDKIRGLEKQLSQNSFKNNELMMELCSVNQTLENLTKQYTSLQQTLKNEKERNAGVEIDLVDSQTAIENLQKEKDIINQDINSTKTEINQLKGQVKSLSNERQTLLLQIQSANEKIAEQDLQTHKQTLEISELNAKLLSKLDKMLESEKAKCDIQEKFNSLTVELENVKKSKTEMLEAHEKRTNETENHLACAHKNTLLLKESLMKRIDLLQNENGKDKILYKEILQLLENEKKAKEILEVRVLEINNDNMKYKQLLSSIKHNICILGGSLSEKSILLDCDNGTFQESNISNIENLNKSIELIQDRIVNVFKKNELRIKELSDLQQEQSFLNNKILELGHENELLMEEKQKLFDNCNILLQEKAEREHDLKSLNDIQLEHTMLKAKYDQVITYNNNDAALKTKNDELLEQIRKLEKKTTEIFDIYKKYAGYSSSYKFSIEKLILECTSVEKVIVDSQQMIVSINVKLLQMNEDRDKGKLMDQIYSFETILEDIQKQFLRSSRKFHEIILTVVQVPITIYDVIQTDTTFAENDLKINFEEEHNAVTDCKDRALDLFDQISAFEGSLSTRGMKIQKETLLRSSNSTNADIKFGDDELKKRNVVLKQRLTLAENAKSNLEKKLKQLRQENKTLTEASDGICNDSSYKTLLQQHIQYKEKYEKIVGDLKTQYNKLSQEYKDYQTKIKFIPDQIKYEKYVKTENDVKLEKEVTKLREAYSNAISDNSRLDLENVTMRKLLEDRTSQLSELKLIKEAYEKLLEENNKLGMELDTVKYKRNKDREALFDALKNAKMENKKIQEVRNEYEGKLEKMKNKMVQLYKEEIDKEIQKRQTDESEKVALLQTIEQLKQSLKALKLESAKHKSLDSHNLDMSIISRDSFFLNPSDEVSQCKSIVPRRTLEDQKYSTLPKPMKVIQEGAILKCNTLSCVPKHFTLDGQNLEMEDEDGDLFSDKHLADLKDGRCEVQSGRESNASRISELIWRNSLCPPHLKSSYPAETQFNSPGHFKENDIKSGTGDFNDSMSIRLLPADKPRKKDFGTTSYKKPGPPTPIKNGGRTSLQSNELREILQEHNNETKTPKRITPNRLKQLFMGRGSISTKENNENQSTTPRSKRLSIFRKLK